jgi:ABC-type molybdate transport system ATPase subunit
MGISPLLGRVQSKCSDEINDETTETYRRKIFKTMKNSQQQQKCVITAEIKPKNCSHQMRSIDIRHHQFSIKTLRDAAEHIAMV